MPYCPKCGIEVDYGVIECPLCSFEIPDIPHEHQVPEEEVELKNYYNEIKIIKGQKRERNRKIAFVIIMLAAVGGVINNTMQDLVSNGSLTFSLYVISALGFFIICMICAFGFIKGWIKNLVVLFFASLLFIFSIDYWEEGIQWYWSLGVPICTLFYGMLFLTIILIKKLKPGKLYSFSIILSSSSVLVILLEIITDLYFGDLELSWSLKSIIPNGSIALLCIAGRQLVKHDFFTRLKRYLHF